MLDFFVFALMVLTDHIQFVCGQTAHSFAFDGQSFVVVCQGVLFCFMGVYPRTRRDYIECYSLQFNGSKKMSVINLILNYYMNSLRFIFK